MGIVASFAITVSAMAQDPADIYVNVSKVVAFDSTCHVLPPLQHAAMAASAATQLATVPPPALESAKTRAAQAAAATDSKRCSSPQSDPDKAVVRQFGDQQTLQWVLRMDALVRTSRSLPWAKQMTTLESKSAALNEAATAIRAANPSGASVFQQFDAEASQILAANCAARRDVRTKDSRACPSLTAQDVAVQTYAQVALAEAERLAPMVGASAPAAGPAVASTGASASVAAAPVANTGRSEYLRAATCVGAYSAMSVRHMADAETSTWTGKSGRAKRKLYELASSLNIPQSQADKDANDAFRRPGIMADQAMFQDCDAGPGAEVAVAVSAVETQLCKALKQALAASNENPRFRSMTKGEKGTFVFPGFKYCTSAGSIGSYYCASDKLTGSAASSLVEKTQKDVEGCFGKVMFTDENYSGHPLVLRIGDAGVPHVSLTHVGTGDAMYVSLGVNVKY